MENVMDGVRVVELATMVAAPSAGGILADWGADVIKVESAAGDPMRTHYVPLSDYSPPFELDNRGKRSIVLDLKTARDLSRLMALIEKADVFLTNLRPGALKRLGLDYENLKTRFPGLVYCAVTGYGLVGPQADKPGYDLGCFFARSALADTLTAPGSPPPIFRSGNGDHMVGSMAAGGIAAALFKREKTGRGQRVSLSLVRGGAYANAWDLTVKMRMPDLPDDPAPRTRSLVPINNVYQTRDGRWIWLLHFEYDRHIDNVLDATGARQAVENHPLLSQPYTPRMEEGGGLPQEYLDRKNALIAVLDEAFAKKTLEEWREVLDQYGLWYEVVQSRSEFLADPLAQECGAIRTDPATGRRVVATPVDMDYDPANLFRPAPSLGQHTKEVLAELGLEE